MGNVNRRLWMANVLLGALAFILAIIAFLR